MGSLRRGRAESSRLAWAFVLSLSLHFAFYAVHLPAWLERSKLLAEVLEKKAEAVPMEVPTIFLDVSPQQATVEPPKAPKYYSNKNSVAANPQADKNTEAPKITGTQKLVAKTEDIPREKYTPLQPSRAPAPAAKDKPAQEELKPKPTYTPGDLVMAKPEPTLRKADGKDPQSRPRTLEEARAQQRLNRLFSEKMIQDGGVAHRRDFVALDTKETAFGDYDAEMVEAITARWYESLDRIDYSSDGRGRVVLQFTLNYDGRVTDLKIEENTVNVVLGQLCRKAVEEPSPYKPWPMEMRKFVGETRHIQFTFYYN
jgi:outer membrane biosynthesis protein TonB